MDYEKSGKKLVGYFITGLLFIIATSFIFGMIASNIGIQLDTDIQKWANSFSTLNPVGIFVGFVAFMILGALVWLFAYLGTEITNHLEGDKTKVKLGHRPYLFTMAVTGIVTVIVLYGLGQVLSGISPNVDLSNTNTLLSAITTLNPMFIIGSFFAISIIGYLVARLAKGIPTIDKQVPHQLKQV